MVSVLSRIFSTVARKGSFIRDVGTLASGTVVAQALTVLVLLVLARLYGPQEFGVFGLFMSILTVLAFTASVGYERAVVLPEGERDAARLLVLAWLIAGSVAFGVFVVVGLARNSIAGILNVPDLAPWLLLLPLGVFFAAWSDGLRYWLTRQRMFAPVARARVAQVVAGSTGQIGLAVVLGWGAGGLIVGRVSGIVLLGVLLLGAGGKKLAESMGQLSGELKLGTVARRYKKFPLFATWSVLLLQAAQQLPIFLVAIHFSAATVGFVAMMLRVVSAPMQVVGSSFEHVMFQRAAQEVQKEGVPRETVERTFAYLLATCLVPGIVLVFFGRELLTLALGADWEMAGQMTEWLAPVVLLNFLVSPLAPVFNVRERQEVFTAIQFARVIVSLCTLFFLGRLTADIRLTLLGYALVESLSYLVTLVIVFRLAGASAAGVMVKLLNMAGVLRTAG